MGWVHRTLGYKKTSTAALDAEDIAAWYGRFEIILGLFPHTFLSYVYDDTILRAPWSVANNNNTH